ncbi:AbrB/MazE/SpoVT family DNA-binding domain-containing protein [Thermithiobacillus plumbiphilus]|uniref:AbrB/MazE/SpoVT family DNA-binding domain-containing protein n=1 Tax=Thermithiobacillus plumbiphilus TaxID=1729899 RepID=A0ABU9D8H7_9PROT
MHEVTLSSKFQLSIPKAIRERLHLKAGQRFIFVTRGDTIALVPQRSMAELRGSLRGANTDDVRDRQDRI